jgi:hypothetical protein
MAKAGLLSKGIFRRLDFSSVSDRRKIEKDVAQYSPCMLGRKPVRRSVVLPSTLFLLIPSPEWPPTRENWNPLNSFNTSIRIQLLIQFVS